MPKYKDPDPLAMSGLDPSAIDETVEAKKMDKQSRKPPSEADVKKEERLLMREQRLAGSSSKDAKAEPEAALTSDEKSKLLDKLTAYKDRFPHLKTRNKTLRTADDIFDELDADASGGIGYEELRRALRVRNDVKLAPELMPGAMGAIELDSRNAISLRAGQTSTGPALAVPADDSAWEGSLRR